MAVRVAYGRNPFSHLSTGLVFVYRYELASTAVDP